MIWAKLLGGLAGGAVVGWFFWRRYRKAEEDRARRAALEAHIRADMEAEEQERSVAEMVKKIVRRGPTGDDYRGPLRLELVAAVNLSRWA